MKKQHTFKGRIIGWNYCTRCGLITLRNHRTQRAVRASCKGGCGLSQGDGKWL